MNDEMHDEVYNIIKMPHRYEQPVVCMEINRYLLRNFTAGTQRPALPHFLEDRGVVEFHPRSEFHQGPGGVVLRCEAPGRVEVPWLTGPKIYNLVVRAFDPMALDPFPYGQPPHWDPGAAQVPPYPATQFGHHVPGDTAFMSLRNGFGYAGNTFSTHIRRVMVGIRHQDGLTAIRWRQYGTINPAVFYNRVDRGEQILQPPKRFAIFAGIGPGLDDDRGPPFIRMIKSGVQMAAEPGGHPLHPPMPIIKRQAGVGWVGISFNGDADAGQWSTQTLAAVQGPVQGPV